MNLQKEFVRGLLANGMRSDGRGVDDFRKIEVWTDYIPKAEGSARVKIGDTEVLVGVKLGVGTPFPDKPDEGVLIAAAELSPLASPDFETGPPREEAIELARVVDRGIREAEAIDTKKLCISPGEKVWSVFLDLTILNHGGNLIDACSLASAAALSTAKMPEFDGEKVIFGKKTSTPLPLTCLPLAVTFYKINGSLIVDPTLEEEQMAVARLTVSTKEDGNITALQKGGPAPLTMEEIEKAFALAVKKGKELRKHIRK